MKKFLEKIIENRKIILFLGLVFSFMGIFTYIILPKQQSPKIQLATAMITTIYPGATADDVEKLVTSKIEDKLLDIESCEEVISYSKNSVSVILYTTEYSKDYTASWDELRREMSDVQSQLPERVEKIQVNTDFMETAGIIYSLSGSNYTYEELNYYGEIINKELKSIGGISNFKIEGMLASELVVELDHKKMKYLGISYGEIADLIKAQNLEIPSGQVEDGIGKINVRTKGFCESVDDVENIIVSISKKSGIVTRIKDIANVFFEIEDTGFKTKINNDNAVLLVGYFEKGKNIIPVGREVEEKLFHISKNVPEDIKIDKILFEADSVNSNLMGFINSLLQGILFVIIVVLIGMGFRNALIVSVAIPMSILLTFLIMNIFGLSIEQISITALIIALGMLVDNAIVVSDSIQRRIDRDEERISSCVNGVLEVKGPILTATLTTVCTFIPILFMNGEIGDYLKSMPIVVIGALLSSYIVAITIIPIMAYVFFKKRKTSNTGGIILNIVDKTIRRAFDKKYLVFIIMGLVILLTLGIGKNIGLKFFPFADTDMMYIDVKSEIISDLDKTEETALSVVELLNDYDEIDKMAVSIGDGLPRFFDTMFPAFPSKEFSQILIKINLDKIGNKRDFKSLTDLRDSIQRTINSNLLGGTGVVKQLEQGEPIGSPVSVRVTGQKIPEILKIAKEIEDLLAGIEGTSNVKTDFTNKQYEYLVDLDKILASQHGLNNYDIQNEINIALRGRKLGITRIDGEEYDLKIRGNIKDISDLANINIKSKITSNKVLLKDISEIKLNPIYPVLKKVDGEFSIAVNSDVLQGYSAVEISEKLFTLTGGIDKGETNIIFSGEKDSINKNFSRLAAIGLIFILFIYIILLIQFNSFVQPIIILLTVPMAAIGSIFGLYITGVNLSFTGFLGMVSLAGIVVNNGIVLIDYINMKIKSGLSKKQASIESAKNRFRPIILSTITTVMGLLPLATMGSPLFTPMAVALISGLLVSTLLTIIVIPVVTSLIFKK